MSILCGSKEILSTEFNNIHSMNELFGLMGDKIKGCNTILRIISMSNNKKNVEKNINKKRPIKRNKNVNKKRKRPIKRNKNVKKIMVFETRIVPYYNYIDELDAYPIYVPSINLDEMD